MNIYDNIAHQIDLLLEVINSTGNEVYSKSWAESSSVGTHVRHMIEYLDILTKVEEGDKIDYASRKRDTILEIDAHTAMTELNRLKSGVRRNDVGILVFDGGDTFKSSYLRELLYQHEHIVHHCAIIRLLLSSNTEIALNPSFGYARSTIEYMKTGVPS